MYFFVSDLHGRDDRYEKLLKLIELETPRVVLMGGDLLPSRGAEEFVVSMGSAFERLRERLRDRYPDVLLIFGNDDPRAHEEAFCERQRDGLWSVLNARAATIAGSQFYGYPYVPPTPFLLKDWERYDVSHFVDPGAVSPEEGWRTVPVDANEVRYSTIDVDLRRLTGEDDLSNAIFLFHTPPYQTALDRAALDGRFVDHVPLDVHVGSIAVRRFIEARQPLLTLHGHVHESARLTGRWSDRIGDTVLLSAAHDGPELALVRIDPAIPQNATRELV